MTEPMMEPRDQFLQEYPTLFDFVYRYVRARIDDPEICKDLVSEIFVKALENLPKHDASRGSLQQWITGITKHHLFNHWKRYRQTVPLDDFDFGAIPEFQQLAFDQLIDHLPTHIRQLLIWRYVDDLTYEQMAHLTHKSPPALRQYFSRLHKQLKTQLGNMYAEL